MKRFCVVAALLVVPSLWAAAQERPAAEGPPPAAEPDRAELERQFAEKLTGAALVGFFTIDGRDRPPSADRYEIAGARKLQGDTWEITARIKYEQTDVRLPIPVTVRWAGDTPMISLTDVQIPLVGRGKFSTRLLFHGDRYAGTWQHDAAGGHMWGRIERAEK